MTTVQVAEATRDLRLALISTDIPEDQAVIMAGAAAGVMMALANTR